MERIAVYTFIRETGGISLESPIILEIGTIFEYWGLTWIVSEKSDDLYLICKQV
jgi:hypothetical protein